MEQTQWVVMIDKNPVGPYSESSIRQKLEAGELRPNDIAFKIPQGQTKPGTEWKFLWQFLEFDRRNQGEDGYENQERRQPRTDDEVRKHVLSSLPQEFHDLPSVVEGNLPPEPSFMSTSARVNDNPAYQGHSSQRMPVATVLVFVACLIGVGVATWKLMGYFAKPFAMSDRIPANTSPK